jgi:O-antigen/teichoic acid export membrane protein
VVPILLIANMFLGMYYNFSIWYKLSDNTNKGAIISTIGAVITILANIILVPLLGYTGSAWATLICYISMAIICYAVGAKYYPIPYQIRRLLGYIGLALVLFLLSTYLPIPVGLVKHTVNAILLLSFVGITFLFERKNTIT